MGLYDTYRLDIGGQLYHRENEAVQLCRESAQTTHYTGECVEYGNPQHG